MPSSAFPLPFYVQKILFVTQPVLPPSSPFPSPLAQDFIVPVFLDSPPTGTLFSLPYFCGRVSRTFSISSLPLTKEATASIVIDNHLVTECESVWNIQKDGARALRVLSWSPAYP